MMRMLQENCKMLKMSHKQEDLVHKEEMAVDNPDKREKSNREEDMPLISNNTRDSSHYSSTRKTTKILMNFRQLNV